MNGEYSIEGKKTRYDGGEYDSLTEARWAVLFGALQVPFEKNKGSYRLPSGYYVPDYIMPREDCFIEIKPERNADWPKERAARKARELAKQESKRVYVFCGDPMLVFKDRLTAGFCVYPDGVWERNQLWCECPVCGYYSIQTLGRSERSPCGHNVQSPTYGSPRIQLAHSIATTFRSDAESVEDHVVRAKALLRAQGSRIEYPEGFFPDPDEPKRYQKRLIKNLSPQVKDISLMAGLVGYIQQLTRRRMAA